MKTTVKGYFVFVKDNIKAYFFFFPFLNLLKKQLYKIMCM